MMLHPTIAQQLIAERQRDLLESADHHRQLRAAKTARTARSAASGRERLSLLHRAPAALTSH